MVVINILILFYIILVYFFFFCSTIYKFRIHRIINFHDDLIQYWNNIKFMQFGSNKENRNCEIRKQNCSIYNSFKISNFFHSCVIFLYTYILFLIFSSKNFVSYGNWSKLSFIALIYSFLCVTDHFFWIIIIIIRIIITYNFSNRIGLSYMMKQKISNN